MGLLDIAGSLLANQLGGNGANQQQNMLSEVSQLVDKMGGVQNLVAQFEKGGLGSLVSSWVGTGANQALSPDQLSSALGQSNVDQVAQNLGVSHEEAASGIANLLPQLIDHLSPQGQISNNQSTLESGLSSLMQLLNK